MNYRLDIDGLRALSILSVVAFHVGIPYVHGGYVGVDVFFVISGFLITKLLLEERARTGKIDLAGFWARRVRRILPSLLLVIVFTLLIGAFVLARVSGEIGNLAKAAIAALLLNANHYFLVTMGDYFGAIAEMNPLLNLWTLAVEEQFYLIWPLLLLLIASTPKTYRKWQIGVIGLASFISCIVLTSMDRNQAFFLMPPRSWEFMSGAALAVLHIRGLREHKMMGLLIAILGLLLLLYSFFFLGDVAAFPGLLAMFPVAGAVCSILAGTVWSNNPIAVVLKTPIMTYIGRISYVWYLWHWPILILGRSTNLYVRHLGHDLLAALLSLLLAMVTHHYFEKPLRRYGVGKQSWNSSHVLLLGLYSTIGVLLLSVLMGAWARYGWFYSDKERLLDAARQDLPSLSCLFTEGDTAQDYNKCWQHDVLPDNKVLLWGDSHANHWFPAYTGAITNHGGGLAVLTRRACMPILGELSDEGCMKFNNYVFSQLDEMRRTGLRGVIVSAKWPEYISDRSISLGDNRFKGLYFKEEDRAHSVAVFESRLQELLEKLASMNLRVLVVLPSPILRFAAVHCLDRKPAGECGISEKAFNEYAGDSISSIKRVVSKFNNVRLMDPQAIMCKGGDCSAIQSGVIAYSDNNHLTKQFTESLSTQFSEDSIWLMGKTSQ